MNAQQLAATTEAVIEGLQCVAAEAKEREVSNEEIEEAVKSFQAYALNPEPSEADPPKPQATTP